MNVQTQNCNKMYLNANVCPTTIRLECPDKARWIWVAIQYTKLHSDTSVNPGLESKKRIDFSQNSVTFGLNYILFIPQFRGLTDYIMLSHHCFVVCFTNTLQVCCLSRQILRDNTKNSNTRVYPCENLGFFRPRNAVSKHVPRYGSETLVK